MSDVQYFHQLIVTFVSQLDQNKFILVLCCLNKLSDSYISDGRS